MAFASIDIEGLVQLILKLEVGASSLRSVCGELTPRARALHVSVAGLQKVGAIAAWAEDQLPGLRRRLDLALVADAARPAELRGHSVEIIDPVLDAAQAEAAGRALARDLLAIDAEGEPGAAALRALLARLEEHLGDPDVMSGFYAELGTEQIEDLPRLVAEIAPGLEVREEWAGRGRHDLEVLSRGFATALHDSHPPASFSDTVTAFGQRTDDHEKAWARLALIQHGPVPTGDLVRFVQANALDQFVDDPLGEFMGDPLEGNPALVGLPRDRLELAFNALAVNPDAARRVISAGPGTAAMVEGVYDYYHHGRGGERVDAAFGAALAAGAGVDEPAGQHSAGAAEFAFDAITATAGLGDTMWFARESYAAIATAWLPEFLAGATAEISRVDESTRTRPDGWETIPSVHPQFYLSLEDTRAFLETFGHTDDLSVQFDRAAGELYYELMTAALEADAASGVRKRADEIATRFGNLAGVQYVAQSAVREAMDTADQQFRDGLGTVAGLVIDRSFSPTRVVADVLWEVAKLGAGSIIDDWAEGDPDRMSQHEQETAAALRGQAAAIAYMLIAADPGRGADLPPSLRTEADQLLIDPAAILRSPRLTEEFAAWLTSTNTTAEDSTYDVVTRPANAFEGGVQSVETQFGDV